MSLLSLISYIYFRFPDNCTEYIPSFMNPIDTLCSTEYYYSDETTDNFCKGLFKLSIYSLVFI